MIDKILDAILQICEENSKPVTMPLVLKGLKLDNTKSNQIHIARLLKAKGLTRKKSNGKVFYVRLKTDNLNCH